MKGLKRMRRIQRHLLAPQRLIILCACIILILTLHGVTHATNAQIRPTPVPAVRPATLSVPLFAPTSPIAIENHLSGTTAWMIPTGTNITFIQGYIGATTVLPHVIVPVYVSTQTPSTYQLDVYRMGWYGGTGGRLYLHLANLASLAQGIWDYATGWVARCATCTIDPQTYLVEAHWKTTVAFTVGSWLSGVYLIKLTAANGAASYIPFVVRAPSFIRNGTGSSKTATAPVLADISVNTYAAYNLWGGYDLYGSSIQGMDGSTRSYKVSFDRPFIAGAGSGDFLSWDIHAVRWMERADLNVTYTADTALITPFQPLNLFKVVMMLGHSEYWSTDMRSGMDQARNLGVNLVFLGADASYWKIRYEPDAAGTPNRTVVCYKVTSDNYGGQGNDLALDPDYPSNPSQVTTLFRDPYAHQEENELLGIEYHSIIANPPAPVPDWVVDPGPLNPFMYNTGLYPSDHISGGLLGYEYDSFGSIATQPPYMHILGYSPLTNYYSMPDIAVTCYYIAPSGAYVFDAGSIWWAWGLDESSPPQAGQSNKLQGSQPINLLTYNILKTMLTVTTHPT
jgi:hypothetical protein